LGEPLPRLDEVRQLLIPLGDFKAGGSLRVAFRQQRGSLPPSFDALTVNSRAPTFWHALLFSNPVDVPDVLQRMTADEARERAARYRQLARQMTDAQTREELLRLASEYEALVETLKPSGPVGTGGGPQSGGR
jgi:hypothetical protein